MENKPTYRDWKNTTIKKTIPSSSILINNASENIKICNNDIKDIPDFHKNSNKIIKKEEDHEIILKNNKNRKNNTIKILDKKTKNIRYSLGKKKIVYQY